MRKTCFLSGRWLALALGLAACAGEPQPRLYLDLLPLALDGPDPLQGCRSFEVAVEGGPSYEIESFDRRVAFGDLDPGGEARLRLSGRDAGGQTIAWGFSEPIPLSGSDRQAVMEVTGAQSALAHAGPALVDPEAGLLATGVPRSLRLEDAGIVLAFNRAFLFIEAEIPDDTEPPVPVEWWKDDGLVVAVDGLRDSPPKARDGNDAVFFLGRASFAMLWPAGPAAILHQARERAGGYTVFAAVPWSLLGGVVEVGRDLRLGLERRDAGGTGTVSVRRWPASWDPDPDRNEPPVHYPAGAATIRLRARTLDARRAKGPATDFFAKGGRLSETGAQPLAARREPGADPVEVFAAWDGTGLLLLVESRDGVVCAQRREPADRNLLLRDDAIELVLAPEGQPARRALINVGGDSAFDCLGGGAFEPAGFYFGFEFFPEAPDDDCRDGEKYLFKARVPWSDLGFLAPPEAGARIGLDLTVFDNDRGARRQTSFNPLGPASRTEELAELRLVDF